MQIAALHNYTGPAFRAGPLFHVKFWGRQRRATRRGLVFGRRAWAPLQLRPLFFIVLRLLAVFVDVGRTGGGSRTAAQARLVAVGILALAPAEQRTEPALHFMELAGGNHILRLGFQQFLDVLLGGLNAVIGRRMG